jgi:hypothetical protein
VGASTPAEAQDEARRATSDLRRVAALAADAGLPGLAAEAEGATERIAEGRFYVACVGQFKRGKSTLINALIVDAVLPTGVAPVTSVVTVIRYGAERGARVRAAGRDWEPIPIESLAAYVSEKENPENEKGVEAVEVFVPAKLLDSGMSLVDTPGVGSVFAGGTRATRAFVPHIDAALVVLGADPPISGEELALVEEVAGHVETLIFVLGKADRLSERERLEAIWFTERVLERRIGERRLGRAGEPILQVSALDRLAGTGTGRDWEVLVERLAALARESGAGLVRAAEARAVSQLTTRLQGGIDEQLRALRDPLDASRERLDTLRRATAEADRALGDLRYLLAAEEERVTDAIAAERERFFPRAMAEASQELRETVASLRKKPIGTLRKEVMSVVPDLARRQLDRWLATQQTVTERSYQEATQRFVGLANGFLARFAAARDLGLDQLPPPIGTEAGLRVGSHLYYTELLRLTSLSLGRLFLDRMQPHRRALRDVLARGTRYLERLLASNSARIQNDLIERVRESRRRLEADLRSQLHEALESAERALERAQERHAAGQESVRAEIERLEALRRATGSLPGAR